MAAPCRKAMVDFVRLHIEEEELVRIRIVMSLLFDLLVRYK